MGNQPDFVIAFWSRIVVEDWKYQTSTFQIKLEFGNVGRGKPE